jgi:opacity protein-like surface antigen
MAPAPEGEAIEGQAMQPQPGQTPAPPGEPSGAPPSGMEIAVQADMDHDRAAERCDLAAMSRHLAEAEGGVRQARRELAAVRAAGGMSNLTVEQAQRNLEAAERALARSRARRPGNCPPGRFDAQPVPSENASAPGSPDGPRFALFAGPSLLTEEDVTIGMVGVGGEIRPLDFLGFDLEGNIGVVDEENRVSSGSTTIEDSLGISWNLEARALAFLPLSPNADLFAGLGYGFARFDFESSLSSGPGGSPGTGSSGGDTEDYWSWGGGVQLFFDRANGVRADYRRWEVGGSHSNVFRISYVRVLGQRP